MADVSKKIASGAALGVEYHIHDRVGTIEGTDTRSETEVTGSVSGGGGFSSGGTGFTNPVSGSIQSKTTNYQNVYLKDEEGDEHTIELVDFLVPCKQGHKVSFFVVKTGTDRYGAIFHAYNFNTRQHYDHAKSLRSHLFPTKWFMIALAAIGGISFLTLLGDSQTSFWGAIGLTIVVLLIAGGILWVAGSILGALRAAAVRRNPAFRQALNALGQA